MKFQTNIVLSQVAADWLDTHALSIRKNNRTYISRSAFVRALVHGVADSGLDFSLCRSERDIAGYLALVIRVYQERSLIPESLLYPTERLGTKGVVYSANNGLNAGKESA